MTETQVSDGRVLRISTSYVRRVTHTGSLYSEPDKIPDKQSLLLCDMDKGEVFTFKPSTRQKQVPMTSVWNPISVSYLFHNHTTFHTVCAGGRHEINV